MSHYSDSSRAADRGAGSETGREARAAAAEVIRRHWLMPQDKHAKDFPALRRRARLADTLFGMVNLYGYAEWTQVAKVFAGLFPEEAAADEAEREELEAGASEIRGGKITVHGGIFLPALPREQQADFMEELPYIRQHAAAAGSRFSPDERTLARYAYTLWPNPPFQVEGELVRLLQEAYPENNAGVPDYLTVLDTLYRGVQLNYDHLFYTSWSQDYGLRERLSETQVERLELVWPLWQLACRRWIFGGHSVSSYKELPEERQIFRIEELEDVILAPFEMLELK